MWDGPRSDSTLLLWPSRDRLQQFAGLLDGDGSWILRSGFGVSIRLGLESKDYRMLWFYSRRLGLGPVRMHGQTDECYLELQSRARVATLLQLLEWQDRHPDKIRQFGATAQRLGYGVGRPPRFQGPNSSYFAGFYDADGSGGIYLDPRGCFRASFTVTQKARPLTPEAAARLPKGRYWLSPDGDYYGYNPVVLLLQKTFGGHRGFSSIRDAQGVLRVTSYWKASSLEDLRRFSDYLERCPPLSAKGR